jgi:hypothetical protein
MTLGAPTPNPASAPPPATLSNPASPPSKRDLKSWWKGFKLQPNKHQDTNGTGCLRYVSPVPVTSPSSDAQFANRGSLKYIKLLQPILAQRHTNVRACSPCNKLGVASSEAIPTTRERTPRLDHLCTNHGCSLRCRARHPTRRLTPREPSTDHGHTKSVAAGTKHQGIFGVPLRQSITYANVAISLVDETGNSYIYGYVPIVVAKCGVFLKEKGSYTAFVACHNLIRHSILFEETHTDPDCNSDGG